MGLSHRISNNKHFCFFQYFSPLIPTIKLNGIMKTQHGFAFLFLFAAVFSLNLGAPVDEQQEEFLTPTIKAKVENPEMIEVKKIDLPESNKETNINLNLIQNEERENVVEIQEDKATKIEEETNDEEEIIPLFGEEIITIEEPEVITLEEDKEEIADEGMEMILSEELPSDYYRESTSQECRSIKGKMECKIKECKWYHEKDEPVCKEYTKQIPLLISPIFLF